MTQSFDVKFYLYAVAFAVACLLLFFVQQANPGGGGGSELGNGGQAIQCIANGTVQYQLFDAVEARFYNPKYTTAKALRNQSPNEAMSIFLSRLKKVDSERANLYRAWWLSFWDEATLIPKSRLFKIKNTEDRHSGLELLNPGCKIVNVAFQHTQKFHSRYLIDKRVYDQMSHHDQFLLVLHELIYREMISVGISEDSRNVRFLTMFMSSQDFFKGAQNPKDKNFLARYYQTLEDQRLHKPWLHPRYIRFVTFLYSAILDRVPEGRKPVEFWARECQKYGVTHVVAQFMNSAEYISKDYTQAETLAAIRKVSQIQKMSKQDLRDWRNESLVHTKKANTKLLHRLVPRRLSCFDFIGLRHHNLTNKGQTETSLAFGAN